MLLMWSSPVNWNGFKNELSRENVNIFEQIAKFANFYWDCIELEVYQNAFATGAVLRTPLENLHCDVAGLKPMP